MSTPYSSDMIGSVQVVTALPLKHTHISPAGSRADSLGGRKVLTCARRFDTAFYALNIVRVLAQAGPVGDGGASISSSIPASRT